MPAAPTALQQFKAAICQALAHPTRIAILELLREGEQSASTLVTQLGAEQANVSQHLAVLRAKRLVSHRKVGNYVVYTLRSPRVVEILDALRLFFHEHLSEAMETLTEGSRAPGRAATLRITPAAPGYRVLYTINDASGGAVTAYTMAEEAALRACLPHLALPPHEIELALSRLAAQIGYVFDVSHVAKDVAEQMLTQYAVPERPRA